jgi:Macrocin-O-methyltransferase (TylF)
MLNILRAVAMWHFRHRPYSGDVAVSYLPDAYAVFKAYPELDALFDRFTRNNRDNNGGDLSRLFSLVLNVTQVLEEAIPGDFAELGVWRGNSAAVLAHYARGAGRELYLFDTFEGFDARDITGVDSGATTQLFSDTSMDLVRDCIGADHAHCHFVKGFFPATFSAEHAARTYAVVNLDCDLYEPMKAGLNAFYPRLARGGMFMLHDYSSRYWAGAKQAVDEFCRETGEFIVLLPDKSGSAYLRKSRERVVNGVV